MKNFKPLFQVAVTGFLLFVYAFLSNNPQQVFPLVLDILKVFILISISVIIVNALLLLINFWFSSKKGRRPSKLLEFVVSVLLYGVCAFIILRILGRDTTTFTATSALLTAVIGFAMKDPLGNILSGVFIQIDQPFQIGERIQFKGLEGVVESIAWNSTDIRLNSGEFIHIPNGSIANDSLKVIPSGSVCRTVDFTTPDNVPPNQVKDVVCKAVLNQANPNINLDKPVFVRMWGNGEYKLFYYPKQYNEAKNHTDPEIRKRIWYALSRAGWGSDYQPTDNERLLQLVSNIEFFRDLTVEAQLLLVQHSKTLLFDVGELLDRQNLLSPSMVLVVRGCVAIEQELISNSETDAVKPFSRRPKNQYVYALKPRVVEQVAFELAKYIGPVAFSLTDQAAKKVSSVYWLYLNLAAEIDDLDRREAFLFNQPEVPTEKFQAGDLFGEMTLFLEEPLPTVKMITVEETELLAFTPAAVATALHQGGISINTVSQYITQYHDNYLTGTLQEVLSRDFTLSPLISDIPQVIQ